MTKWDRLSEPQQLHLANAAMREAALNLTVYAETLAEGMAAGQIADRGGCEALRLFASVVRALNLEEAHGTAGHA